MLKKYFFLSLFLSFICTPLISSQQTTLSVNDLEVVAQEVMQSIEELSPEDKKALSSPETSIIILLGIIAGVGWLVAAPCCGLVCGFACGMRKHIRAYDKGFNDAKKAMENQREEAKKAKSEKT